MNWGKPIVISLAAALLIIQFIQPARNSSSKQLSTDIANTYAVPPKVLDLLKTSCYDCHSNNTNYPWYAGIQPAAWILAGHISNGKSELNFSEFGSYTLRRRKSKLKAIESSIRDNSMPLRSYTLLHKNAVLSEEEKALLVDWAMNLREQLTMNK